MDNQSFSYTYSAQQQEQVKRIRDKYQPKQENKVEQLIRLDRAVTAKGTAVAIAMGTISTLVLGTGMSMVMVWGDTLMVQGTAVGIIGIIGVCLAYPLYKSITKKQKQKYAPKIMQLTDEILGNR